MAKVTKKNSTMGSSKVNQTIFNAYQIAINNRMKAGKDVSRMTDRLNLIMNKLKK